MYHLSKTQVTISVIYSYADSCRKNHNDTIIKQTSEGSFRKICTSHFIVRVRKGYSRFYCERELETEPNCNILTPTLMAVSVVSFSLSRDAQPEAQEPSSLLDDGFLYCSLSATSLDPNSIGGPAPLQPGVTFPTTSCLYSNCLSSCLDWVI